MKEKDHIPTSRSQRTGKFIKTSAKVGGNYLKHYGKKLFTGKDDTEVLHRENAETVYETLSELKGSALKVAQMMSLDQAILPRAFADKFAMAQYSAPPLSYPLVVQTFRKSFGKEPQELFDRFSKNAVAAASIGQVHQAMLKGEKLAVKVQYPGVADSIGSDLRVVKPIVRAMVNISAADLEHYAQEIEERLIEETDYNLELIRSKEISSACAYLPGLVFPEYYPELSSDRILTMQWLEGSHLDDFLKTNPDQETRNHLGQLLWDFYDFQIHTLHQVHADPHPGNFLFREDGTLGIIDFGCIKQFPESFYNAYFRILEKGIEKSGAPFDAILYDLKFLLPEDTEEEQTYFRKIYADVLGLLTRPFFSEYFDFSDQSYFDEVFGKAQLYSNDKMLRRAKAARGPRDAIYLNRTYFGLYALLNKLKARVQTKSRVHEIFVS